MRKLIVCLAAIAFGGIAAAEAQTEIKFGHVGEPGSLFQLSADEFARRANEKLGDKAKVVVFGSSQLGTDEELLQKLLLGTADMALPSTVMSSVVAEFGLFEMPYLVKDRGHMRKIEQEVVWPTLAPAAEAKGYEAKGYKVLAVWENGFRNITNNVRPIVTPQDLAGIKLRTPSGAWRVKMFQAYGANPTPCLFPRCSQRSRPELSMARRTRCRKSRAPSFTRCRTTCP
jgi:TRAP-type C4-dicarboxylate transport system substrate-binding protein